MNFDHFFGGFMHTGTPKWLFYSALIGLAATLSACDSATTDIVERDPIVVDAGDHKDEHHDERGRLLISAAEDAQVSLLDLDDYEVLARFETTGIPSALYASPDQRYGLVIQRDADRVDAVDGGLWAEAHGDHMDLFSEAPQWLSFSVEASGPSHFAAADGQMAIFYDGSGSASTPARVGVFTEATLADDSGGRWLDHSTPMHGAAQARGDYLLSSLRDPMSESARPDRVALYHWHDDHFDEEQVFDEACPGLHGSAQAHEFSVFGCTDGVLVIEQQGSDFTARKIPNPSALEPADAEAAQARMDALVGHEHHEFFVGVAGNQLFEIDPETAAISPIGWTDEDVGVVHYAFADGGELFVVLDTLGRLHVLSVHDGWSVLAVVPVLDAPLSEGQLVPFDRDTTDLTVSGATHEVFVLDGIGNRVRIVDLDHAEVASTISLDFKPLRLTWLGVSQAEGSAHVEH